MAEQRLKGFQVTLEKRAEAEIPSGTVHFRLKLGGDAEGLRAVGYIVQTFLAHHLPRIARKIKLKSFKDYILSNIGADFVWWDFDAPALPANAFPFGHVSLWALMQRRVLLTVAPRSFRPSISRNFWRRRGLAKQDGHHRHRSVGGVTTQ